jgi:kynurenine formamidase
MSRLVDLTLSAPAQQRGQATCSLEERNLMAGALPYTAMVYHFRHDSMAGTYIDFPGHIKEADDGLDSVNYPPEKLFRVEAAVVHLQRLSGSGPVSANELRTACPPVGGAGALILNALGALRFDGIVERSVYLSKDAVQWIIDTGFHLLVSDVYESNTDPQKVFNLLFAARVSTVCCPINLHHVNQPLVRLTALPLCFPKVTQLPCRVIVELDDAGG